MLPCFEFHIDGMIAVNAALNARGLTSKYRMLQTTVNDQVERELIEFAVLTWNRRWWECNF